MVQYMCNKDDIRCREFSPIFDDLGSEREAKNVHLDYEYQE
jgi:hypothetical protein